MLDLQNNTSGVLSIFDSLLIDCVLCKANSFVLHFICIELKFSLNFYSNEFLLNFHGPLVNIECNNGSNTSIGVKRHAWKYHGRKCFFWVKNDYFRSTSNDEDHLTKFDFFVCSRRQTCFFRPQNQRKHQATHRSSWIAQVQIPIVGICHYLTYRQKSSALCLKMSRL